MKMQFIALHEDCPAATEGRVSAAPKFTITDFTDDGRILTLTCSACPAQMQLTLLENLDAEAERSDALDPPQLERG